MDNSLWKSMIGGDRNAFLSIHESHYHALFSYGFSLTGNREITKDCLQDLFLEIWNTRGSINKDVTNISSYLFTWLRRKIFKEINRSDKEKSGNLLASNFLGQVLPYEDLLVAFQQSEEDRKKLSAALKKLTRQQLLVIRLKFFEKLSYEQIAIETSLTQRTVYNLIYEAIRHLRQCMKLIVACI